MRYEVVITWPCRAVVSVEAVSREDAEERALDAGVAWDNAIEDDDGAGTTARAHFLGCVAIMSRHEQCCCDDVGGTDQ